MAEKMDLINIFESCGSGCGLFPNLFEINGSNPDVVARLVFAADKCYDFRCGAGACHIVELHVADPVRGTT